MKRATNAICHAESCILSRDRDEQFVFVLKGIFEEFYEQRKRNCRPFMLIFRPLGEEHREHYGSNGATCLSVDINSRWMESLSEHSVEFTDSPHSRNESLSMLALKLDNELDFEDDASPSLFKHFSWKRPFQDTRTRRVFVLAY